MLKATVDQVVLIMVWALDKRHTWRPAVAVQFHELRFSTAAYGTGNYCSFQTVSSGRLNVTRDLPIGSLVIGSSTYVMRDGEPIGLEIVHSARDSG